MTTKNIKKILCNNFNNDFIEVVDINITGDHFSLLVISDDFIDMTLLNRHKLIYELFKNQLTKEIHALQIKTYTKSEWEKINS